MPDLLIEIGTEELPASACREVLDQVPAIAAAALEDERLAAAATEVWVSPRRYATLIRGLPAEREGRTATRRGPAVQAAYDADGAPTKAAEGFARGQGVTVDALQVREQDGREFVFADIDEPALAVADLVPGIAERLIARVRFSKTMRWGDGTGLRFSRPVRWIVAKLDEATITFECFGLTAAATSRGHRFLGGPVRSPRRPPTVISCASRGSSSITSSAGRGSSRISTPPPRRPAVNGPTRAASSRRCCTSWSTRA